MDAFNESTWEPHPSAYKINEFKRIVRNFWLLVDFLPWKSRFSLHEKSPGTSRMLSKTSQVCSLKSGGALTYLQNYHTMSMSQYNWPIRHLTKSMNSRGSSEISDFQSSLCLEKVDFPCMKNGQELFWCVRKHPKLVLWSQEMVLDTHKVTYEI